MDRYAFGLGIEPGSMPGESELHGRKVVGWQNDTPITYDPSTGQMFVHQVDMETGEYTEGIAMPTTVTARHGGRGPIATSPTGSGRVFWSPGFLGDFIPTLVWLGIGLGIGYVLWKRGDGE